MLEIEKKFLVKNLDFQTQAFKKIDIVQGYLNSSAERTVRVRKTDHKGFLTIKGKTSENGLSRYEWEKQIPLEEAENLLELCESGIIEKTRYLVKVGNHLFEVDEFKAENEGLLLAELELSSEDEEHPVPDWLGKEVTGNRKYYNSNLRSHPYCNWGKS